MNRCVIFAFLFEFIIYVSDTQTDFTTGDLCGYAYSTVVIIERIIYQAVIYGSSSGFASVISCYGYVRCVKKIKQT